MGVHSLMSHCENEVKYDFKILLCCLLCARVGVEVFTYGNLCKSCLYYTYTTFRIESGIHN